MSKKVTHLLVLLITIMAMPLSAAFAQRQGDASSLNTENLKMLGAYIDVPSMDTTPVEFTVGNVHYKAPRNYIANMDNYKGGPQSSVTFRVAFPDFEPLNEKTKDCLTLALAFRPQGCIQVNFWIGNGEPLISDDDHFKNGSGSFLSQIPKQGPYGYEMYESGGGASSIETYRKKANGHTLVIDCLVHDIPRNPKAVCTKYFSPLPSGNVISYNFYLSQLEYVEQIDKGIRDLVNSFTLTGGKQ